MNESRLAKRLQGMRNVIREIGFWEILRRLFYTRNEFFFFEKNLMEVPELTEISSGERVSRLFQSKDIDFISIENNDERVLEMMENHPDGEMRHVTGLFRDNIQNNYRGFVAIQDDTIIGYVWWVDWSTPPAKTDITFRIFRSKFGMKNRDVYGFDLFIVPQCRGSGSGIIVMVNFCQALKDLGYSRLLSFVHSENRPSQKLLIRIGFTKIKEFTVRRLFAFFSFVEGKIFFSSFIRLREN